MDQDDAVASGCKVRLKFRTTLRASPNVNHPYCTTDWCPPLDIVQHPSAHHPIEFVPSTQGIHFQVFNLQYSGSVGCATCLADARGSD
jgi:hypothetical protein